MYGTVCMATNYGWEICVLVDLALGKNLNSFSTSSLLLPAGIMFREKDKSMLRVDCKHIRHLSFLCHYGASDA
jgi:hypothetical protein